MTRGARYENCMLLFYRRRGIVEINKVELRSNQPCLSLLSMPSPYTSIVPTANADLRSTTVSFELSSPVSPSQIATVSLKSSESSSVVAAKSCHGGLMPDNFDVRMVSLNSRTHACEKNDLHV